MNLQQVRYLVAFADHGTMTAAAAAVPVAQPVLTRSLRALERELDIMLFRTQGRGLVLTDEGVEAVDIARRILDASTELSTLRGRGSERPDRPLVLATTPSIEEIVGERVAVMAQAPTTARFEFLTTDDPLHVVAMIQCGEADLGIVDGWTPAEGMVTQPFLTLSVGLLCRSDHALPTPIPLRDLGALPLIVTRRGTARRSRLDGYFSRNAITPSIAVETGDRAAWPGLVRAERGYAIHYANPWSPPPEGLVIERFEPPLDAHFVFVHAAPDRTRSHQRISELIETLSSAVA